MIQYPKEIHVTLPSVEGGFGTMNIMKDPPKGVYTRFIPKVGTTSRITDWIDSEDTGNRICEVIKPYARGINPAVSVDYSNTGSNGGQYRNLVGQYQPSITTSQAYYPYTVNRSGAYRPPITPPEELLPLSRLPRLVTLQQTNPGSEQMFVQKGVQCKTDLRTIRDQLLKVCAPPRALFNIETPASKPYEIENHIQAIRSKNVLPNISAKGFIDKLNEHPSKKLNNLTYQLVTSKPSEHIQVTNLEDFKGNQKIALKNILQGNFKSNINGIESRSACNAPVELIKKLPYENVQTNLGYYTKENNIKNDLALDRKLPLMNLNSGIKGNDSTIFIHKEPQLDRNMPLTSFSANSVRQGYDHGINNRTCKLAPRPILGGYCNGGYIQQYNYLPK